MPQVVPSIDFYIKLGGYEPSTGFHFPDASFTTVQEASILAIELSHWFHTSVVLSEWVARNADGSYIDSGALGIAGTSVFDFDDFRDTTHIQWASDGDARPSGNFIPARHDGLWAKGQRTAELEDNLSELLNALVTLNGTDSEGSLIRGVRRCTPGRRRRMRMSP